MQWLRRIYSVYGFLMFGLVFLALLPFFLLFIQRKAWHKYTHPLNRWWARGFLFLAGIPVTKEMKAPIRDDQTYVFCANHFSWLDIVLLGLTPPYFVFIGKKSLAKMPLFGYMYRNLHILVDRDSSKSRYETYVRSREAVQQGKSLAIFPEGGIRTTNPPTLASFKEGAFRIAIEQQIPIVPVTIPYNWIILSNSNRGMVHWHRAKIIYHEPIPTRGLTMQDVDHLKEQTAQVIQAELYRQNPHENRSRHFA